MKRALITGITGQDGSYLAEFLLQQGYEVYGLVRRLSVPNVTNIKLLQDKIHRENGDMQDQNSLTKVLQKIKPDEVYNLAAQSFVTTSFTQPVLTSEINALGVVKLLDALQTVDQKVKFYQASTSEMFGKVLESPQTESTPFYPRSPYAIAKLYAYWITRNYRESYGMFNCNGILFNHESPRRGVEFVTRKITTAIAKIKAGQQNSLVMGNMSAKRDWGYAPDYVRAMWAMLQQDQPDDYVIGMGKSHTVQEFVDLAFNFADLRYEYVDLSNMTIEAADQEVEKLNATKDKVFVVSHPAFYRPAEVNELLADASKARKVLKWVPTTTFEELVRLMVENDLREQGIPM